MGPYSRGTSHTTGAFFEMFYEQPMLMLAIVGGLVAIGLFLWWKSKRTEKNN
jgi:hypothetical protein